MKREWYLLEDGEERDLILYKNCPIILRSRQIAGAVEGSDQWKKRALPGAAVLISGPAPFQPLHEDPVNFTFFPLSLRSGNTCRQSRSFSKACVDSCIASSVSFPLSIIPSVENMGPVKAVAAFISKRNLKNCLLALSGGVDSLALTCSHQIKTGFGGISGSTLPMWIMDGVLRVDKKLNIASIADTWNLPFHLKEITPVHWKAIRAACREARYGFFQEVCLNEGLPGVMVAPRKKMRRRRF